MLKDLRHAARVLLNNKAWTAVVVLSLALGIGANTALFSAVNGLLLEKVPVPDPDSLVRLQWAGKNDMVRNTSDYGSTRQDNGDGVTSTLSYDMFQKLRAANQTLIDLAAGAPAGQTNVIINGKADFASAFVVSGNYFTLLRLQPFKGRLIQENDDHASAPPAIVISHQFWVRRLGSDPNVVGRVITVNGTPLTIVGVLPASYTGIQRSIDTPADLTFALALDPVISVNATRTRLSEPTHYWLQLWGRLKPGATAQQAHGNFNAVFQNTARAGGEAYYANLSDADRGLDRNKRKGDAVPRLLLDSAARGIYDPDLDSRKSAGTLSVVVVLVLLLVCANVANLMLARAAGRRKEVSLRLSIGASRGRLVRQLLTESLLLAAIGGSLGILFGYWSRALIPFGANAPMNWPVLAFTSGISILAGLLVGLIPALRATQVDLAGAMKENSRSVVHSRTLLSRGLLVVQVAISVVLLVGAGLFLRTVSNLRQVDVGFNSNNLLMFRVNPQLNGYNADRTGQLYRELKDALLAVPGVRAATYTQPPLLSGSRSSTGLYLPGQPMVQVHIVTVSPEFFETMEMPFLKGQTFGNTDTPTSPKTLIINDTVARKIFPDGSAIGRRAGSSVELSSEAEIIGVIRDAKYSSLREPAPPTIYRSFLQYPPRPMSVVLRMNTDPNGRIEAVREAVRKVDADLPIAGVATQAEQIERRFAQEQLFATAYTWFGGLALVIAAVGLFGLMSYSVSRRTNEIGVRMALGAARSDVSRMVLRESMLLVAIGLVIGGASALIAAALVSASYVERTLFGVVPRDTTNLATAIIVMTVVALGAAYLPARRASKVDPMVALRYD
ncbi:MAG TPA: ABC transporter permease [Vicinamibacterales bacterium]|nr:ABC transporter permease [Vicinamibacterales bacterium]